MNRNDFDVIIIGAGIGGLVCGCYLAKNGVKVLIVDKNANPGGCCNSFNVKGFLFDGCAHSLGNLSEGSRFCFLLKYFDVKKEINFIRYDPSDTVFAYGKEFNFWSDLKRTIEEISKIFPGEKSNIRNYFEKITETEEMTAVAEFRNKTFKNVLDKFFRDPRLKNMLSLPVYGNLGVSPSKLCAFTAAKHYKQFLLDGGYYPEDGIQSLPNVLSKKFQEFGGKLILSDTAIKIIVNKRVARGVVFKKNGVLNGKFIVSNCDAKETFLNLIGLENLKPYFAKKLNKMLLSFGLFIIYLGWRNENFLKLPSLNNWYLLDRSYDKHDSRIFSLKDDLSIKWFLLSLHSFKNTAMVFTEAPFKDRLFWSENKYKYMDLLLKEVKSCIPLIPDRFDVKVCSPPTSIYNWTLNSQGAAYGWASTTKQFLDHDFLGDSVIDRLFLSSHWSTIGSGVNTVAVVADRVAKRILHKMKTSRN